jgi:hypothetical protein
MCKSQKRAIQALRLGNGSNPMLQSNVQTIQNSSCASPKPRTPTKSMTWREAGFGLFR